MSVQSSPVNAAAEQKEALRQQMRLRALWRDARPGVVAGWLRDQGIAMAAIAGGMIVAFSWWHVNQLGVGLHSYGFTNGILTTLHIFYGSQLLMLGLGLIASTRQPRVATEPSVAAAGALASS